jgi:hypothetical protein
MGREDSGPVPEARDKRAFFGVPARLDCAITIGASGVRIQDPTEGAADCFLETVDFGHPEVHNMKTLRN